MSDVHSVPGTVSNVQFIGNALGTDDFLEGKPDKSVIVTQIPTLSTSCSYRYAVEEGTFLGVRPRGFYNVEGAEATAQSTSTAITAALGASVGIGVAAGVAGGVAGGDSIEISLILLVVLLVLLYVIFSCLHFCVSQVLTFKCL